MARLSKAQTAKIQRLSKFLARTAMGIPVVSIRDSIHYFRRMGDSEFLQFVEQFNSNFNLVLGYSLNGRLSVFHQIHAPVPRPLPDDTQIRHIVLGLVDDHYVPPVDELVLTDVAERALFDQIEENGGDITDVGMEMIPEFVSLPEHAKQQLLDRLVSTGALIKKGVSTHPTTQTEFTLYELGGGELNEDPVESLVEAEVVPASTAAPSALDAVSLAAAKLLEKAEALEAESIPRAQVQGLLDQLGAQWRKASTQMLEWVDTMSAVDTLMNQIGEIANEKKVAEHGTNNP